MPVQGCGGLQASNKTLKEEDIFVSVPISSELSTASAQTLHVLGALGSLPRKSEAIEVLVPLFLTTSCLQVLSLWDPSSRSHVPLASGLSSRLLLPFGHPEPHPAPLSQGHLQGEAWSTQHSGLQALPCWTVLLGLR